MLRFCDDEWVQQLKSGIESWLLFMIQNVSPGLLGTSVEAVPLQEQQLLPAVGQASAAEILAVPEVRVFIFLIYVVSGCMSLFNTCAHACDCVLSPGHSRQHARNARLHYVTSVGSF